MTIEYDNERDLVNKICKSNINIFIFSVFLLDKLGVTLSKTNQSKIENAQRKRNENAEEVKLWIESKNGEYLRESDIPQHIAESIQSSAGLSLHDAIYSYFGSPVRKSMFYKDIILSSSGYLFTQDGLESILYKFYINGLIPKP